MCSPSGDTKERNRNYVEEDEDEYSFSKPSINISASKGSMDASATLRGGPGMQRGKDINVLDASRLIQTSGTAHLCALSVRVLSQACQIG